ncbi:MAG: hypothetical protein CMR00_08230 [[Chlorobium] sp. 445]|nr:MAG: hypothetical protein CMR00_08230 [[Chlorobium] sp. 445]
MKSLCNTHAEFGNPVSFSFWESATRYSGCVQAPRHATSEIPKYLSLSANIAHFSTHQAKQVHLLFPTFFKTSRLKHKSV